MHKAKKIINYNLTMNIQNNSSLEAQKDSIFKEAIRDLKRKKINVQIFASKKLNYKTIWSADEDRILLDLIKTGKTKDWKKISTYFKNKSPIQCSARFKRINPINNKGKWTNEEDEHLLKMIGLYGKNWSKITKHFKSRTGKQMRDRYLNVLSPEFIKDKFDEKEDEIIIDMYKKLGTNWAEISKHLPRRTPDMIKNRFYQYLKAKNQLNLNIVKSENLNNIQNKKNEQEDELSSTQNNRITILDKDSKCKILSLEIKKNNELTEKPKNLIFDDPISQFSIHNINGNDKCHKNFQNKLILDNSSINFEKFNYFAEKILTNDLNSIVSKAKSFPSYIFCNGDGFNKMIITLNNLNNELFLGLKNRFNLLDINKGCDDDINYYLYFIKLYSDFLYSLQYSQTILKNMFEYFERIYKNLENSITKDL